MNNLFVTYEIAKLLKEKGFNEPCICQYMIQDSTSEMSSPKVINLVPLVTSKEITVGILPKQVELNLCAPLYQQVVDWFREKHKINFNVIGGFHDFSISIKLTGTVESKSFYGSYYEVLKKAIEEALKLI
jgi:hypothetical protein